MTQKVPLICGHPLPIVKPFRPAPPLADMLPDMD